MSRTTLRVPSGGETQITQSQATGYAYGPAYEYTIADFQAEDSLLCNPSESESLFSGHRRNIVERSLLPGIARASGLTRT